MVITLKNYIILLFLLGGGAVTGVLVFIQIIQNLLIFRNLKIIKQFLSILPLQKW